MKIMVLVKEVPDTYGERVLNLQTGLADRAASESVLDEIGERALEVALRYLDENPETEVTLLTMSPDSAVGSMRKGLAMGASSAVHIVGEELLGADLTLTAEVLAAALAKQGFDLVIAGNSSTDGSGGVLPTMLAEHLGVPQLTALSEVVINGGSVAGLRSSAEGTMEVSAALPAVISITEALPDSRFPSFKGIMAAKKKPYDVVQASELGVRPDDPEVGRSIVIAVTARPQREAGLKIVDDGDAGERIADYLIQNRLA